MPSDCPKRLDVMGPKIIWLMGNPLHVKKFALKIRANG